MQSIMPVVLITTRGPVLARLLILVLICCGGSLPARADAQSGLSDFQSGRFSQAFQAWHDAAERGDATSALYLGVLYDTGIGVPQDYHQAIEWYERAASAGSTTAMLNAAIMHDAGRGTEADPATAAAWYERAASRGNGRAEYNLGLMYQAGSGVPVDRNRAVTFYRAAERHGILAARAHLQQLGVRYASVPGRQALDPAVVSFQRAQDVLLQRGVGDAVEAFELFRVAAEAGNPLAAYNLAYYYEHGIGVQRNDEQAIAWYRRSEAGAADAATKDLARSGLRHLLSGMTNAQR